MSYPDRNPTGTGARRRSAAAGHGHRQPPGAGVPGPAVPGARVHQDPPLAAPWPVAGPGPTYPTNGGLRFGPGQSPVRFRRLDGPPRRTARPRRPATLPGGSRPVAGPGGRCAGCGELLFRVSPRGDRHRGSARRSPCTRSDRPTCRSCCSSPDCSPWPPSFPAANGPGSPSPRSVWAARWAPSSPSVPPDRSSCSRTPTRSRRARRDPAGRLRHRPGGGGDRRVRRRVRHALVRGTPGHRFPGRGWCEPVAGRLRSGSRPCARRYPDASGEYATGSAGPGRPVRTSPRPAGSRYRHRRRNGHHRMTARPDRRSSSAPKRRGPINRPGTR